MAPLEENAMIDLADMILFHAEASPEKPALVTGEVILTYRMLGRGMVSAARRLRQTGLKPGDCVAVSIASAIAHITLICALHQAGIASVSLAPDQVKLLDDLVVDAVLADTPRAHDRVRTIAVDESWFNDRTVDLKGPFTTAFRDDDPCRFILSSGTTGHPKIIGLTYRVVRDRLVQKLVRISTPSWDRMLCMPGLSTGFGWSFIITALWLGRTACFTDATTARQAILSHQAELLVGSTHQVTGIVAAQEERFLRLDSLRSVHIGGSIVYTPLLARIRMLVCPNVFCAYGSTEGNTIAYVPADPIFGMERVVGIVAPWVEMQVFNGDKKIEDYGCEGEIRLRAEGRGYRYQKVAPGRYEKDQDEWFYPGDRGILYRNGLLAVTGRLNEIINRGGEKVAPDEIEERIKQHPLVADAAAVGVPDNLGIEQIWVAVVTRDGRELDMRKMLEYCRERLPLYVPDRVFQVAAIPRNHLGKISRITLSEELKVKERDLELTVR
jgi:ansamitocin polyketide synthase A